MITFTLHDTDGSSLEISYREKQKDLLIELVYEASRTSFYLPESEVKDLKKIVDDIHFEILFKDKKAVPTGNGKPATGNKRSKKGGSLE
jgi:hypothetical protein